MPTPVTINDPRVSINDPRVNIAGDWVTGIPVDPGGPGPGASPWTAMLRGLTIGSMPYRWAEAPVPFGIDGMRTSDTARPLAHGLIAGAPDRLGSKVIDLPWLIDAPTEVDALLAYEALADAWAPVATDATLQFTSPARSLDFYGRPRRIAADLEHVQYGIIQGACQFEALDPRGYGAEISGTVGLGSTTGGLSLPHDFPHGFGSGSIAGALSLHNNGNAPTERFSVTLTAQGTALTNPRLELLETGEVMALNLSLGPADSLVLDFYDRTVILNRLVSRAEAVARPGSRWWAIPDGFATLRLTGSGSGTAVIKYRPAWIF